MPADPRRGGASGRAAWPTCSLRSPIPAIVRRRHPGDQDAIGVGISFPIRQDDRRLRFAAAVTAAEIAAVISPYAIARAALRIPPAAVAGAAGRSGISIWWRREIWASTELVPCSW